MPYDIHWNCTNCKVVEVPLNVASDSPIGLKDMVSMVIGRLLQLPVSGAIPLVA